MIAEAIQRRYSGTSEAQVAYREFIQGVCQRHVELGLADPTFEGNVCSDDEFRHWQGLSEALVGHELLEAGLNVLPSRDGPDFLVQNGEQKIWVEVICPTPTGIPHDWLSPALNRVVSMPHQEILLRWTAAIKEKAEKLLGNSARNIEGYVQRGVVRPEDAYVIAVNGCLLRGIHRGITGISQFPFAVEATLQLGPYAIRINPTTLRQTGEGHTWRASIPNANGAEVPTDTFFDPRFAPISAVLAVDLDGMAIVGGSKPMALVYNPMATNRVTPRLLPAYSDYVVTLTEDNGYQIARQPGLLNREPDHRSLS